VPEALDSILKQATATDPALRHRDVGSFTVAVLDALGDDTTRGSGNETRSRATIVGAAAGVNPYKGLRAFDEADTEDFFGRADLAAELFDHLNESRFLVVTGPSGAGKSSVVRAGLTPRVRRANNFVATISPGPHPMDELETALHRLSAREPGGLLEPSPATIAD
jgi:hypothetical protein